jgi:3-carboxy-cis,cis-muconate cycloisomerase
MPTSAIDSAVFRHIFGTEQMRKVWSDENRTQRYLDIEAALARAQAHLGVIPAKAAAEITKQARVEYIDFEKLQQQTERIGYPVLGVVQQLVELCRENLGQYCHWGATTQDITDTSAVLQIREALVLIEADLNAAIDATAGLARAHRDTPMAGRSNLQQAVPITFGFKMATLLAAFMRHKARLGELRTRLNVVEFGGACGTLASLGKDGLQIQAALARELGLAPPEIAWHTQRDRIAEAGCFLGLLTGTLAKFATDVKLLMQTEVGEVSEPYLPGRGSSSTMPQKRNPISCCYIHACAASVRQHVAALMDAMTEDHERATGPWEIEWIALPEVFTLAAGALSQARTILSGLNVDPERMRANLDLSRGLIVSEAVMMGLAPYLGRERSHDLVYDICSEVSAGNGIFLDLLAAHPAITPHLRRDALSALLDPANYLGMAPQMVDAVLEINHKEKGKL